MNKISINTCKYIFATLLTIGLFSCNNSGSGTNTGMQNTTATAATDSNIGILPGGSVVYSSASKYVVPADKTTSGTFILSDGKNENGVFEVSVTPANNQNDITKLPSVKVLSELSSKTHGVYSVEINANNASPGKYVMMPEFVGDNSHKTKLNSLVLEITNSTQKSLKTTTTNLKEQSSATNTGNLSIAFIYSQNQHIPQFAIVTLSNSHNVSNLPVKVSILGKKGISGDNINTVCNFSSSVPNNFCEVQLPNNSIWTQGILTVSANGYTSISKHFLRDGYLTLQVNNNIVSNNQKNILTVNLVNSENVHNLPVEVSIDGNPSGAIGISNNLCTLSTNNPSCNVDLYGIVPSDGSITIKAYVQGTNQGNDEPATAAINVISPTTMTEFSLNGVNGIISGDKINVTMPYGTDLSNLIAAFSTAGGKVSIAGTLQVSGQTTNNFTIPITYTVIAQDGSTKNYTVTAIPLRGITSYSINGINGIINEYNITVILPYGSSPNELKAQFQSPADSITVNGIPQVSNQTVNNFSQPLKYIVTGINKYTKTYTVTVTVPTSLFSCIADNSVTPSNSCGCLLQNDGSGLVWYADASQKGIWSAWCSHTGPAADANCSSNGTSLVEFNNSNHCGYHDWHLPTAPNVRNTYYLDQLGGDWGTIAKYARNNGWNEGTQLKTWLKSNIGFTNIDHICYWSSNGSYSYHNYAYNVCISNLFPLEAGLFDGDHGSGILLVRGGQ